MSTQHPFSIDEPFNPNLEPEQVYIGRLYEFFLEDLVNKPLMWKCNGAKVSLRRLPEVDGRHAIFWHIISGGDSTEEYRSLEDERCIRIGWIRPLVEIFNKEFPNENEICWWKSNKRSSHPRYLITRPDFDYVVVIEERPNYALLITAYYVEHEHRRRKLRKEHEDFKQKQEPPIG